MSLRLLLALSLGLISLLAPVQAQHTNVHISSRGGSTETTYQTGNESIKIEQDGEVQLSADDRSITGITGDGYFRIKKTTFGNTRELFIRSSGGTLTHEYREGGRQVPFEPAGRAWLADILPDLVRSTTIGAQSRVDRLYQKGGARGVMNEIAAMKSDHAKARYAELLLKKDLKESEIPFVIEGVGQHIGSDHYRYEVFKSNSSKLLANPQHLGNYLSAIKTVGSDHYKTGLVKLALERNLPAAYNQQALQLIATIESDHYKSEILKRMLRNNLSDEQLEFLLGKMLGQVESDHYRTEIITVVLKEQPKLSPTGVDHVIRGISQTTSDHYATESLKRLVSSHQLSSGNYEALFGMLNKLGSDHYKSEFMRMLVKDKDFGKHFGLLLRETERMDSDHYRSEILRSALNTNQLSDEQKASLAKSAATIKSDHYKTEVLLKVCSSGASAPVKAAVQESAKSISSTHYYGSVMKCVQ
ncbi:hypothetical protein ADICEAN_03027 [Cesiribacter andamanensis AMV16]|uniref:Uncharacterized protein n=1 Tax=Cesiribacter andamanensis AMV16 TaxID=1279009 RepID=M7N3P8_9BACT|nr:hypothetical protein ADICEAN_03027 [Cesiribacter andamanensis AMV16]